MVLPKSRHGDQQNSMKTDTTFDRNNKNIYWRKYSVFSKPYWETGSLYGGEKKKLAPPYFKKKKALKIENKM